MTLDWLVGVALSVVGNVLVSLGTNVLKLGHNKRLQMPLPHPAYKDRFWQAGLAMYGVGNVAMFYAFGYAAQSILAAIGCIQFCSNVLFAWLVLKETVTRQILTATGLIVVGCVLLVAFGSNSSNLLTVQQLLDLYKNHAYIAYLVVGGAVAAASFLLHCLGSRIVSSRRSKRLSLWAAILPVLYSLFSALVGTQSLIFNKAVMVLWRLTLAGDNQFDKWVTWLMAVGFLVTAALWVVQLNKGLQRFPALIIVPCMQLCWTLFGVISGLLYFKEYVGMSGLQVAMFVLGVVVVCMGAGTLAHASQGDMAGLHPADSELNEQEWTAAGKAAHAHAAAPVTELQVAQDSADFKLRVVWSGTDSDQVLVAHLPCASDRGHEQGSALESLGSAPLLPSSGSLPPSSAAQRAQPNLPSHGSLDASGLVPGIGTRRDHRRMSRLRTCSMPLHDYVPKR